MPDGTVANRPSLQSNSAIQWTNTGSQTYSVIAGSATGTNTTWTCPAGVTSIEVLVVAGGGGGGGTNTGGGGGGGGLIYRSNYPVTPTTVYTVTVGAGGSGGITTGSGNGGTGSNSAFDALIATGGGYGGGANNNGGDGGSGGGAGSGGANSQLSGNATAGQGFPGGGGLLAGSFAAGGGGGAGGVGGGGYRTGTSYATTANSLYGSDGGPGLQFSISGTPTYYAGGGGGGSQGSNGGLGGGLGGVGGGGAGRNDSTTGGGAGTASTGGGGGGTGYNAGQGGAGTGGAGGSGTVIIRYTLATASTQPHGQIRFNTVTGNVETFEHKLNTYIPTRTKETIVTNGLVLHLDAAKYNSTTTWTDLSTAGNNGTLTNSPTYSATDANGYGSFNFNGTNQYAVIASPVPASLQMTTEITLSAWIFPTGITSGNLYQIVGCQYDTGTYKGATIFIDSRTTPYTIHFQIGNTSAWAASNDSTCQEIPQNVWSHVTATWRNGQKGRVYINGFYNNGNDTTAFTGPITYTSGQEYSVGRQNDTGRYFSGRIAAVQVYSRALNGGEVLQNYNALAPRFNKALRPVLGLTPDTPAPNAQAIKNAWPGAPSGFYWLQPPSWPASALIYCEMQLHGGGWIYTYQKSCVDDVGLYLSEFQSNSGSQNHAVSNFYGCVDRWGKTYTGQDMWNAFIGANNPGKFYAREIQVQASNSGYDESQSYTDVNDGPIFSYSDFSRFFADQLVNGTWRSAVKVRYNNGSSVRTGMTGTTWSAPSLSTINNGSIDQNMYFCNGQTGGDGNWSFALMKGGTPYPRLADSYNGGNRHASVTRWAILAIKA
jgi:hypothetical protein